MDINKLTYGPVPSRRLGRSLGINNIPAKICSYACIYCQLGNTLKMSIERKSFYNPEDIYLSAKKRISSLKEKNEKIDYLAFVPDGEPTLDINLAKEANLLKEFNIKLAIITNGSLMYREDVQNDLMQFEWVSLKVDFAVKSVWKKIDRPHGKLNFEDIKKGYIDFSKKYKGLLNTETMLVKNINDDEESLKKTAGFIKTLNPNKAYISIPIRPPAENNIQIPDEEDINRAYLIFNDYGLNTELLVQYEGDNFTYTNDFEKDILAITSVHPIREDALEKFLKKSNASWQNVENLIKKQLIKKTFYNNHYYFSRILKKEAV
ncbi:MULTISPECIES: radical SAM protein [unclassified Lebetimonas]|uniref:radical SAM protein n=1 Tax=unclassified Lebetimonas TaxID=2648158 RepID=UPI0004B61F2D|nr:MULTISPECIES: radical SAM protein [unclassified Lebetimonas]